MTTIKIIPATDYVLFLKDTLKEKGVRVGDKFGIKFKRGKRWKMKAFRLVSSNDFRCECCGGYETVILSKGEVGKLSIFHMDSHFGPSSVLPLLRQYRK